MPGQFHLLLKPEPAETAPLNLKGLNDHMVTCEIADSPASLS